MARGWQDKDNTRPLASLCSFVLAMLIIAGAATASEYPAADGFLGERLQVLEQDYARHIGDLSERKLRSEYGAGQARRDAHAKAHACLTADFQVLADLPVSLQHGVFQPSKQYRATVRFSNGSPDAEAADRERDTRGMAIKLLGVTGPKLLDIADQADAQDLLLMTSPVFFVNNAEDYAAAMQILNGDSLLAYLRLPFVLGWQGSINAAKMLSTRIDDPLATRYWSAVPYQFGLGAQRRAVKYSARPCAQQALQTVDGDQSAHNYLRTVLADRLKNQSACMEFMLQVRSSDSLSVEDVVSEWEEEVAPFYPVAKLVFPPQQFDTDEHHQACEAMSFNPWHGLEAHRPLGAVNRVRKVVYLRMHAVRQEMNAVNSP